ncbi:MAG: PolC-type DNA polymerase III [Clostridia bacterium]|nr:PolC-type DNA polymerase III [Clostridia bacterium]
MKNNGLLELFDKVTVVEPLASTLEQCELKSCRLDMVANRVEVTLASKFALPRGEILDFASMAADIYGLSDFDISFYTPDITPDSEYVMELIDAFLRNCGVCRPFLSKIAVEIDGNKINISNIVGGSNFLVKNSFTEYLRSTIKSELDRDFEVNLIYSELNVQEYLEEREKAQIEITNQKMAERSVVAEAPVSEKKLGLLFGKPIPTPPVPISTLELAPEGAANPTYVIEGTVLTWESREIKSKNERFEDKVSIKFAIGDDSWSCSCNAFAPKDRLEKVLSLVDTGKRLKLSGTYEVDQYIRKPILKVRSLELLENPPVRMDNSEEKRVELHAHSKMSALDGISSVGDLINRAAKWGHKALAITDHGVAQAFPDAHKAASKHEDFKVIYGIEGYLIDDMPPKNSHICLDSSYVVFDIETTGLSPSDSMITEIGAIKIEKGEITKTFSHLINPQTPIPPNIVELTGITDDMVRDMPTIDEVLPEFLEFCRDSVVVAHNASFDCGFIRYNATKLGLSFHNKTLDTLKLSRELFPGEKKHSLDVMCKRLGVSLENHHRAVDDATATAEAFLKLSEMVNKKAPSATDYSIETRPELVTSQKYHVIILAKNYVGLKNLYKLISMSNLKYFHRKPGMPKSIIEKHREGLIIGSACEAGELFRGMVEKKSTEELLDIAEFYDFLEIQPLGNNEFMLRNGTVATREELQALNKQIVEIGDKLNIPTVATCDVHFLDPEDAMYRRVLMGAQGYSDADLQAPLFLRTTEEMLDEFSYLGDRAKEIVIDNTCKIADMCEKIQPVKDGSYPPSIENCEQDLVDMCHEKAHRIYGEVLPEIVQKRMDRELDCITKYGYSVMYMIAHKLVKKSNEAGYLVGSRGSVGSSFAAFLSDITEVNALCPHYICPECKHSQWFEHGEYPTGIDMPDKECPHCGTKMRKDGLEIPFETFLGFKGDKVPDIDLNFSGEYQATAHKYVGELFGDEYVFKAGTIGTIAEKTAIAYAKKYYEEKGIVAPEEELIRVSKGLVDVKRTTGQHPGGIIVCPKTMDIHDFCPIQHPADKKDSDIITTHFDFHSIHDNLLKLDILGHDDPSTIRMLEDLTGINALEVPLDDPAVMSLFSGTEALGVTPEQIGSEVGTFGVPEFGTSFVRGMLVETKPTTFVELLIISGLSHGTDVWLNNAQDLVKAKTATLSEVIGLRDDIMVYLIHKGLEPGMAFKIMEFVRKGRAAKEGMPEDFENAMRENNVPDWYIDSCKKIKYMFPKAHAAAYVMMALRIAYFKVHHPLEFYAAYFTVRADLFDAAIMTNGKEKVKAEMQVINLKGTGATANEKDLYTILEICLEMYERGYAFLPVDLYKSHARKFRIVDGAILPPLNAFAGVGDSAAEALMNGAKEGKFLSQEDLKSRTGVNKSVVETLAENGVLDGLAETSQIDFFGLL